jgi:peptide/nickel transport system substrate-binding protein
MSQWEDLQAAFQAGRLSRREFLGLAAVLGISGVLVDEVLAQAPRRGGQLIVGVDGGGSGDVLDPARMVSVYQTTLLLQMYDTLTVLDEKGRVQPSLAETWEARPGAREWIVKLRKGVTFHNGKDVTAEDVVYSINHHRKKDSKSSAKALLAPVTDVKATGKQEVTLTLESGYADMPALLTEHRLCIGPDGSSFTDAVGTGAFVLESFQPGVRARTKRNPNDWRKDRGYVDSVETVAINDPTARMAALQSGSIHLMNRADPRTAAQMQPNPPVQFFSISGGGHYCFPLRADTPPYDNNDLRLALKYAVDREAIVKTVLRGYGRVGNDHPVPPFDPFFAADIPQRPYDPDKAKFHLAKSGYSGPIVISVADVAFTGAVDAAQLFQASAAKAGITIQVDRVPNDGYWDNVWMKKPFAASYWSGRPTTDLLFALVYSSDAKWNETYWKRPRFDKLLAQARAELDTAKRKEMYREMQLMVHEDGAEIIPMFNNYLDAGVKRLRGFVPMPTFFMSGARAPEKVWLDG